MEPKTTVIADDREACADVVQHLLARPDCEACCPESRTRCAAGQFVFLLALVRAVFAPHLRWRGVTYRISGPWNVQLLDYRPYKSLPQVADATVSL